MATIENGFDSKPTHVKVHIEDYLTSKAYLEIEQEGVPRYAVKDKDGEKVYERIAGYSETLAYMTIVEAISLRDELNAVIRKMAGV